MIFVGPVGKLVTGDVLDVNKRCLEDSIKFLYPNVYLKWNPNKLQGHGCWELRQRPDNKSLVYAATYQGVRILEMKYRETGINHLKDFPFLNYRIIEWLKGADLWSKFNYNGKASNTEEFLDKMEASEIRVRDEAIAKSRSEMKYNIMQDRGAIKKYQEEVARVSRL